VNRWAEVQTDATNTRCDKERKRQVTDRTADRRLQTHTGMLSNGSTICSIQNGPHLSHSI
jgi:hypothetical protein